MPFSLTRAAIPCIACICTMVVCASSATAQSDGRANDVSISVLGPDGSLLPDALVSVTSANELRVDAVAQPDGTYLIEGAAKTIKLEVVHATYGVHTLALNLPGGPATINVSVDRSGASAIIMQDGQVFQTGPTLSNTAPSGAGFGGAPAPGGGIAGPCGPGNGGDCCMAQTASPGCDDADCCVAVCAADGFCCAVNWDSICATAALLEPLCDEGSCVPVGCVTDGVLEAPTSVSSTTCGAGNDCALRASTEHLYQVNIPNDGLWTFSLCGSSYDTYLFIGTTCCGSEIALNDDFCGLQSQISVNLAPGTYFVAVEAFGSAQCGDYTLDISKEVVSCADFVVTAPGTFMDDTTGGGDTCDVFGSDGEDHIYEVTLPNDGVWTFALCGSAFDTKIEVGTTCCGSDVGTNDDSCGLQSSVTATLTAGTYFVTVFGSRTM